MNKHILLAMIVFLLLSNLSLADTGLTVCTKKDALKADELASTAANWEQLYGLYRRYHQCDDGAIAEGFSESVSILLSKHWRGIDKLLGLTKKDDNFEIFILNHIDETVPMQRLLSIANLATNKCPSSAKTLCEKISKRINGLSP
jgi:hypothetical protein